MNDAPPASDAELDLTAEGWRPVKDHGFIGLLMTFADRALGRNAWKSSGEKPVATIEFNMHFVSAGALGEFIQIRPEVVRKTASLVFMRGDLTAASRVVATATGIWKIL